MIDPMLLHHAEDDFVLDDNWVLELKYDGVRAILDTTRDGPILYTRRGTEIHTQFPEIDAPEGLILDGEIVGFDGPSGRFHKLNWVQRRISVVADWKIKERAERFPCTFVAFDFLTTMEQPLHMRRSQLMAFDGQVTISPQFPASNIDKMWQYVRENNLEGLVAKKLDSKYVPGTRTYNWRKIKHEKPTYRKGGESAR